RRRAATPRPPRSASTEKPRASSASGRATPGPDPDDAARPVPARPAGARTDPRAGPATRPRAGARPRRPPRRPAAGRHRPPTRTSRRGTDMTDPTFTPEAERELLVVYPTAAQAERARDARRRVGVDDADIRIGAAPDHVTSLRAEMHEELTRAWVVPNAAVAYPKEGARGLVVA